LLNKSRYIQSTQTRCQIETVQGGNAPGWRDIGPLVCAMELFFPTLVTFTFIHWSFNRVASFWLQQSGFSLRAEERGGMHA
jgi:hypothetical protein